MNNKPITAGVLMIIYGSLLMLVQESSRVIVTWIILGIVLWYFVGGIILILIDNETRDLKKWLDSAPPIVDFISVCAFPIILFFWEKARREGWWK